MKETTDIQEPKCECGTSMNFETADFNDHYSRCHYSCDNCGQIGKLLITEREVYRFGSIDPTAV